jgi:V8-like Glu-specific endopeptidase
MRALSTLLTLLAFLAVSPLLFAEESDLIALESRNEGRGWEGVGRLDITNRGFCTAALITERLILTAAHCVYDRYDTLLNPKQFTFQAGLRNGRAEAIRNIKRLAPHPEYISDGPTAQVNGLAMDIAVLELDRPIRQTSIQPFAVASRPHRGDQVGVVSYGAGRTEAPSLQELCTVLSRQSGAIIMNCDAVEGSSGSPVFSLGDGAPQIVSVVSAIGETGGQTVSVGTSLQEPLQELLAHFATIGPAMPGGNQSVIRAGQRSTTGAKFLSP